MKSFSYLLLAGIIVMLTALQGAASEYRYVLIIKAHAKASGEDGSIRAMPYTTKTIVQACAEAQEPALNPKSLLLVYDVLEGKAYVVDKLTGETICEVFTLSTQTALSNSNGTQWEMLIDVDDLDTNGENGAAICSLFIKLDRTGNVNAFKIRGNFHLVYADEVTGNPIVCNGVIATGGLFRPRFPAE